MKRVICFLLSFTLMGCGVETVAETEEVIKVTREPTAELYIRETIEPTLVSPDVSFEDEVVQIETYSPEEVDAEPEELQGDGEAESATADDGAEDQNEPDAGTDSTTDSGVAEGSADVAEVDEPEPENTRSYYGCCRITFYCPCSACCGQWAGGSTASGSTPTAGWTVANGSLPFGTLVEIDGHTYCVEDRGVSGDQFDIFVNDHGEALARGLYYSDVYIVEG